jgi:hypothetical protein
MTKQIKLTNQLISYINKNNQYTVTGLNTELRFCFHIKQKIENLKKNGSRPRWCNAPRGHFKVASAGGLTKHHDHNAGEVDDGRSMALNEKPFKIQF